MKFYLFFVLSLFSHLTGAQETAQDLFTQYRNALFQIQIIELASGNKSAIGSGFRVGKQGLIATNYHVISDYIYSPDKYRMQYMDTNGEKGNLTLHNFDIVNDLAIVKTEVNVDSLTSFTLANTLPRQGVPIYSLGNPHDLGMIVVPGTFNGLKKTSYYQRIHFTGSINPGMSGGPVVNNEGLVIGVNVATAGNQIGFLIPLGKLSKLVDSPEPNIPSDHFKKLIKQQLFDNQANLIQRLIKQEWPTSKLGKALVPDAIADFISCWGNSNADDKKANYLSVENRCRLGEKIYINRRFQTGAVEMEFEWLESDEFGTHKFFNFFSNSSNGASPGNPASSEDVSNFQCQNQLVTNKHNVKSKTVFCLRGYKDYLGLYDVLFVAATLDHQQSGLIGHFTLSGVDKGSAQTFSQYFMDAIKWQ